MVGKSELLNRIRENMESQQQQQQQMAQQEAEDKARANALIDAERIQKISLAKERQARMIADIGLSKERISESVQNRAQASLDRVKALTELQKLSDERLMTLVNFLNDLEERNEQKNRERNQEVLDEVAGIEIDGVNQ